MNKLEVGLPRTQEDLEFDVKKMGEALEEAYLSKRKKSKPYNRKTYPPSGVGYLSGTCPRRWYYEFNGNVLREDDFDALGRANMDYGTEAGNRIADLFKRADLLVESERLVKLDSPPIKGYIDLVVNWNDERTIGEVKTTKQEAFTLLRASGKPRGYQLIQLLIYMKAENARQGFMLYENKNTGEILIMPVYMDKENQKIVDEAFEWFNIVYENKELPTRPFKKSDKECKYCPLRDLCWKDETGVVTLPILRVPE